MDRGRPRFSGIIRVRLVPARVLQRDRLCHDSSSSGCIRLAWVVRQLVVEEEDLQHLVLALLLLLLLVAVAAVINFWKFTFNRLHAQPGPVVLNYCILFLQHLCLLSDGFVLTSFLELQLVHIYTLSLVQLKVLDLDKAFLRPPLDSSCSLGTFCQDKNTANLPRKSIFRLLKGQLRI